MVYYTNENIFDIEDFIKSKYPFFGFIGDDMIREYFTYYIRNKQSKEYGRGRYTIIDDDEDYMKITDNGIFIFTYKNKNYIVYIES